MEFKNILFASNVNIFFKFESSAFIFYPKTPWNVKIAVEFFNMYISASSRIAVHSIVVSAEQ